MAINYEEKKKTAKPMASLYKLTSVILSVWLSDDNHFPCGMYTDFDNVYTAG